MTSIVVILIVAGLLTCAVSKTTDDQEAQISLLRLIRGTQNVANIGVLAEMAIPKPEQSQFSNNNTFIGTYNASNVTPYEAIYPGNHNYYLFGIDTEINKGNIKIYFI
jgi:hypothetical protein